MSGLKQIKVLFSFHQRVSVPHVSHTENHVFIKPIRAQGGIAAGLLLHCGPAAG